MVTLFLVVAMSINPKIVGGSLFLNAKYVTLFYIDNKTDAERSVILTRWWQYINSTPSMLRSFKKVEP
ncbi:unnamed protein product, partial [Brassica rapa subsp. trilocularis]